MLIHSAHGDGVLVRQAGEFMGLKLRNRLSYRGDSPGDPPWVAGPGWQFH